MSGEAFQIDELSIFKLHVATIGRNSDGIGYQNVDFINIHNLFLKFKNAIDIYKNIDVNPNNS